MNEELLSIQEAASFFGVSPRTLRRWEEKGVLKSYRTAGNQRRYSKTQLQEAFKKPEAQAILHESSSQQPLTIDQSQARVDASQEPVSAARQDSADADKAKSAVQMQQPVRVPKLGHHSAMYMTMAGGTIAALLLAFVVTLALTAMPAAGQAVLGFGSWLSGSQSDSKQANTSTKGVLAAGDQAPLYELQVNVPSMFSKKATFLDTVTIRNGLTVSGVTVSGGIITNNADINAGSGEITASNVIYSVIAGSNVTISGDPQNPVISAQANGGVTSFQGQTGTVVIAEGSGIDLNGLTIANTGVLTLGGASGNVSLTGGDGISVSGTSITNSDRGSLQNIFKNIVAGATTLEASDNDDTLTFAAGSGISITGDAGSKTVTITSNASGVLAGLTTNGVLYATSANSAGSTAAGTDGYILKATGPGTPPEWVAPGTVLGFVPFDFLTDGTNTTADMIIGSGATLGYTGSGTINATSLLGSSWVSPGAIGSTTANTGAFTTLTATTVNGLTVTNNGTNTLTIAAGKTFTANNTLTLNGTDGTAFTFPSASDTLVGRTSTDTLTNKTIAAGSNTISGLTNANLSGTAGITNANLANASLTVTAGTGMSGGGSVALGSSVTLNNAGVLSLAGTSNQISASAGTGAITLSLPQDIHAAAAPTFASLTLSDLSTDGGIVYTNAGVLGQTTAGNVGQCLTSNGGAAPIWSTCAAGDNLWQSNSGAISPFTNTLDLLVGGTSTASAKFAFMNVNNGTPTASISGTTAGAAVSLTGEGVLATSNNRSLIINPNGGNVGIGIAAPTNSLHIAANAAYGGMTLDRQSASDRSLELKFAQQGVDRFIIGTDVDQNNGNNLYFWDSVANAARLLIHQSGSIGIGTTNPIATLDVRGVSGTLPIASFSGQTSRAGLIVDNNGIGDLFTASKSGATKFVIRNNGNVDIAGNVNITAGNGVYVYSPDGTKHTKLSYDGSNVSFYSSGQETTFIDDITIYQGDINLMSSTQAGRGRLYGDYNPGGTLYLESTSDAQKGLTLINSLGGGVGIGTSAVGNGGLVVNQQNASGDIFAASASGTTRFTIANNGDVRIHNMGAGVVQSNSSGVLSSSALNLAGGSSLFTGVLPVANGGTGQDFSLVAQGAIPYFSGTGVMSTLAAGSTGQCLTSGGAGANPTWSTCAAGANLWQSNLGTVSPLNITNDLLLGGTSTASAKFAFINNAGGTPTASISGSVAGAAVSLTGNGVLSTTNNRSLILNPNGGNVGIGTNDPGDSFVVAKGTGELWFGGTNGRTLSAFDNGSLANLDFHAIQSYFNSDVLVDVSNRLTAGGVANGNLTIGGAGTGFVHFDTSVGIETDTPLATLDVRGNSGTTPVASFSGTTSKAALFVDNNGTGDLFTASKSGATKFVINNAGNVGIGTSTPESMLEVAGDLSVTGGNGAIVYSPDQTKSTRMFWDGSNTNLQARGQNLYLNADGGNAVYMGTHVQMGGSAIYGNYTNNGNLTLASNNSSVAGFTLINPSGGRVGIGTSNPIATFDVRGDSGTLPVASFSGTTARAAMFVDNNGTGDLFTASKSGATKFVITNGGNVGIGDSNPIYKLRILENNNDYAAEIQNNGTTGFASGLRIDLNGNVNANGKILELAAMGVSKFRVQANGSIGVGTASPLATMDIRGNSGTNPVASISGQTAQAALIVDNNGVGDLFTASKSGATKFVINNAGNIGIGFSDPYEKLLVDGNVATTGTFKTGNTEVLHIALSGSGETAFMGTTTGDHLNLFTSNTERLTIRSDGTIRIHGLTNCNTIDTDANGQLGCGTDEGGSASTLQGAYDGDADGSDSIIALNGNDDSLIFRNPASGGTDSSFLLNLDQLSTGAKDALVINSAGANANFGFRVNDDGTSSDSSPFVIDNLGNVGIGTSTPTNKLELTGSTSGTSYGISSYFYTNGANTSPGAIIGTLDDTATSNSSTSFKYAGQFYFNKTGSAADTGYENGAGSFASNITGGSTDNIWNVKSRIQPASGTTITNAYDFVADSQYGTAGTVTSRAGVNVRDFNKSGTQTLGTQYGLLINDLTSGTTNYSIYTGTAPSLFGGNISVNGNTSTPLALNTSNAQSFVQFQSGAITKGYMGYSADGSTGLGFLDEAGTRVNMLVTNSGRVGIGTSSPLATLDIRGNSGTTPVASVSGTTALAAMFVDNNGVGDLFTASKSGATKFVINNAGNVGIGAANPGTKLHLSDSGNSVPTYMSLTSLNSGSGILFSEDNSVSVLHAGLIYDHTNNSFDLRTGNGVAVGSLSTRLSIARDTGSIGIGTTSPTALLDVAGAASVSGSLTFRTGTGSIQTTANNTLTLGGNTTGFIQLLDTLDANNNAITNVDSFNISDPGAGEGIGFNGTAANWKIDVSNLARANADGNLNLYGTSDNIALWRPSLWVYDASNYTTATALATGGLDFTTTGTGNLGLNPGGNVGIGLSGTNSLLAKLDVRGTSGTIAVASFSGQTSRAAMFVDNNGTGDIFTASKSGATKFVINNAGNVGIGTNTPNTALEVSSGVIRASGTGGILDLRATGGAADISTSNTLYINNSNSVSTYFAGTGSVAIGNSNPLATLDVRGNSGTLPVASFSSQTARAAMFVDNNGTGDLFTASKSGATKFVINNAGNVGIGVSNPTELLSLNGKIRFNNAVEDTTNGNVKIFTGAGPDSSAQGGLSTGLTTINNYGATGNGLVFQYGGTNDSGGMKLTDDGLTVWGAADENLFQLIDEDADQTRLLVNSTGDLILGNSNTNATSPSQLRLLDFSSHASFSNGFPTLVGNWYNNGLWGIGAGTNLNTDNTLRIGSIASVGSAFDAAQTLRLILGGTAGQSALGTLDVRGVSGTLPTATISAQSSFAAAIVDQGGVGDLFTASKSGATKFTVLNNGTVRLNNYLSCTALETDSTGLITCGTDDTGGSSLFTDGGATSYLTSQTDNLALGGTSSSAPFFFDEANEILNLTNTTGGNSFRVNDVASDTTPFIIDGSGNVGIGMTTADNNLDVLGTAEDVAQFNSTYGDTTITIGGTANATGEQYITFRNTTTAGNAWMAGMNDDEQFSWDYDTAGEISTTPLMTLSQTGTLQLYGTGTNGAGTAIYLGDRGSTGNPYIKEATGDSDILELGGSDGMIFATGTSGTERMAIDLSGNVTVNDAAASVDFRIEGDTNANLFFVDGSADKVGIGTNAPSGKLAVAGSGGLNTGLTLENTSGTTYGQFYYSGNDTYLAADRLTSSKLFLGTGSGSQQVTLDGSTGSLGINTVSPNATLDVRGTSGTLAVASVSGQTARAAMFVDNNGIGDLFTASKSGATKFVIGNNGNVGVGTAAPRSLLDLGVDGSRLTIGGTGTGGFIDFGSTNALNGINYNSNELGLRTNQSNGFRFYTNTDVDTATPEFTIDDSGNVGIGTAPQAGIKLTIDQTTTDHTTGLSAFETLHTLNFSTNSTAEYSAAYNYLTTAAASTTNYGTLNGLYNTVYHRGDGTVSVMRGAFNGAYSETTSSGNISNLIGSDNFSTHFGTGVVANAQGVSGVVRLRPSGGGSDGDITTAVGVGAIVENMTSTGTGVITNGYAFYADGPTVSGTGTITNAYGMRIENQGATGVTNAVGLRVDAQSGAATTNYAAVFAGGNVGIGNTAPTTALDVTGEIRGTSFSGSGLTDCDATNSKLLWDDTTEQFSCGTDRGSVQIRKTANESVTSSTAFQNDDQLTFAVGANETWIFHATINTNSPTTPQIKYQWTAPTGATCNINAFGATSSDSSMGGDTWNTGCSSTINYGGPGSNSFTNFDGSFTTGANSGSFTLQWAQETSSGTSTTVYAGSSLYAFKVSGADYAETYFTKDQTVQAGDVVGLDSSLPAGVKKTSSMYQKDTVGIVSTQPGDLVGDTSGAALGKPVPLALSGRVPVKVSSMNGSIEPGDYLTTSSIPGVAMKATKGGQVIGKAMESYSNDDTQAVGKILVFVNLTSVGNVVEFADNGQLVVDGKPYQQTLAAQNSTQNAELNASFSAAVDQQDAKLASMSGELSGLKDKVASLEANMEMATSMSQAASFVSSSSAALGLDAIDSLDISDAVVSDKLSVLGRTTLSDVGITGDLSMGLLTVKGLDDDGFASINTSSGPLKLQSAGLNGIDILDGKLTIDTKGNLKTEGEITTKKLNIDTPEVASASLGEAILEAGLKKVTVTTTALTESSKIFVEPQEIPVITAVKKVAENKFEIRLKTAETVDVKLNWWIVN